MPKSILICDIDGTLFDNQHRKNLIPEDRTKTINWVKFNNACLTDKPIWEVIRMVRAFSRIRNTPITFITARGLDARINTKKQLQEHFSYKSDLKYTLVMRLMDDDRSPADFKRAIFTQMSHAFNQHTVIIDDSEDVINMVRERWPFVNAILVPSHDCANK